LLFDGTDNDPHPQTLALKDDISICVTNKIDAGSVFENMIGISAHSGMNIDALLDVVSRETRTVFEAAANTPSLTRTRHREALLEAKSHIEQALKGDSPDLVAEDIRMVVRSLGKITGRTDVEDLLDIIFRDFCIGK
jgi:tRNA modification GTPase